MTTRLLNLEGSDGIIEHELQLYRDTFPDRARTTPEVLAMDAAFAELIEETLSFAAQA